MVVAKSVLTSRIKSDRTFPSHFPRYEEGENDFEDEESIFED